MTDLGIRYAQAEGEEKKELSLELLQCFHTYLMKYLDMILRGHLPRYGGKINDDAKILLIKLLPKGPRINNLALVSRTQTFLLVRTGQT